jgi:hypothetical protein
MGKTTIVDMAKNLNYNTSDGWHIITTNKTQEEPVWKQSKYKTIDEYLEAEYGKTKLKRGRWRILLADGSDKGHELWHQCSKEDWDLDIVQFIAWSELSNRPVKPRWRCEGCWSIPPESIVTVFTLMEPDGASYEIRDALEDAERRRKLKEDPDYVDNSLDDELEAYAGWGGPNNMLLTDRPMWDIGDILGD